MSEDKRTKQEKEWDKKTEESIKAMQPLKADYDTCKVVDAWQACAHDNNVELTPEEALSDLAQYAINGICKEMDIDQDTEEEPGNE